MSPARRNSLAHRTFWSFTRHTLRKEFHSLLLRSQLVAEPQCATIYIANHYTWWDGFFIYAVNELYLRDDARMVIRKDLLDRFPFLRRLGAFSVDQMNGADNRAAVRECVHALRTSPSAALWMFPTGVLLPRGSKPYYKDGFARIAAAAQPIRIIPTAFRPEYLDTRHPDVFCSIGPALHFNNAGADEIFRESVNALDRLQAELDREVSDTNYGRYTVLLPGRDPAAERFAEFLGRLGLR